MTATGRDRPLVHPVAEPHEAARPETRLTGKTVALCLLGFVVASSLLRAALTTRVHAPTVFSDEIGYMRLAQSIGQTGHFGLFDNPGMSYSPLYPLLISPIFALGASAAHAYTYVKLVNAFLMSLAILPTYKIARFALPRRTSLLAAGLSALLPLMSYPSFTMSENLAYPLCLCAFWAMLAAISSPGARTDALLLGSIALATLARIQLVVLLPAALTAIVLAAILRRDIPGGIGMRLRRSATEHRLLLAAVAGVCVLAVGVQLAGHDVLAAAGRYAEVGRSNLPNLWHFLNILIRHVAGIDLAVGVVPFVGSLVAAYAFFTLGLRRHLAFAVVALSTTAWLLVEVAYDAAVFDSPHHDIPRVHERFLIYVIPLFVIALLAACRIPGSSRMRRATLAAVAVAALLPAVIPFRTMINNTISFESLGLEPFARVVNGVLVPVPHATLVAVWVSATLGLLYWRLRDRTRSAAVLVLLVALPVSSMALDRIQAAAVYGRSVLPAHVDWVDRTQSVTGVTLFTAGRNSIPELETAYSNLTVSRLYYLCRPAFGPEFGEERVTMDGSGRLRDSSGFVHARYVVVPWSLGIQGRVLTWNGPGGEALVAPPPGPLTVSPRRSLAEYCAGSRAPTA